MFKLNMLNLEQAKQRMAIAASLGLSRNRLVSAIAALFALVVTIVVSMIALGVVLGHQNWFVNNRLDISLPASALRFDDNGMFRISVFNDLHFGEGEQTTRD